MAPSSLEVIAFFIKNISIQFLILFIQDAWKLQLISLLPQCVESPLKKDFFTLNKGNAQSDLHLLFTYLPGTHELHFNINKIIETKSFKHIDVLSKFIHIVFLKCMQSYKKHEDQSLVIHFFIYFRWASDTSSFLFLPASNLLCISTSAYNKDSAAASAASKANCYGLKHWNSLVWPNEEEFIQSIEVLFCKQSLRFHEKKLGKKEILDFQ